MAIIIAAHLAAARKRVSRLPGAQLPGSPADDRCGFLASCYGSLLIGWPPKFIWSGSWLS